MNKKRVLIVGRSAKEYALAKLLSQAPNVEKVYIAPGNRASAEFAERVDIRESDVQGLFAFAIKEEVNLTVASSVEAIKADIAGFFQANEQPIFAPTLESAGFAISRGAAKKFLYKLHIPTPKFGIFEKQALALDYVKSAKMPLLITADEENETSVRAVCANVELSKTCINDLFMRGEDRVVIEDYVYGHPFTLYVMSDGYCPLIFSIVGDYKFIEEGDGGLFTRGVGAFVPDYKVSFETIQKLQETVVEPIIRNLENHGKPYLGILGIECVLKENGFVVTGFTPFLKEHDAQAVLNSLETNIYSLLEACAVGSFGDEYNDIPVNDSCSVSCVLVAKNEGQIINGLDLLDDSVSVSHFDTTKNEYLEWLTNTGRTLVLTQSASTINRAKELLYENIAEIDFNGKKFRRDICS